MKMKAFVLAAVLLAAAAIGIAASGSDASSGIEVKDGLGNSFSFDGPVDRIITIGVGPTACAVRVGAIDKIAVCDSYSRNSSASLFDELREKVAAGEIAAGGNIYSSGKAQLQADIIDAADPETGSFDRDKDVVFVTGSDVYRANIVPFLQEKGFRNILQWYDITEYAGIIGFAKTISLVSTGSVHSSILQMENLIGEISGTLEKAGKEKAKAFYVTYSGSAFKVGNAGSLATSMIIAAGGDAVTVDPSKPGTTYEANLTDIVSENRGVIVFADNSIAGNPDRLSDLRTRIGSEVAVVPLQAIWNNYTIESMDGVWTMACAMYPGLFSGDVPVAHADKANTALYAGIGAAVVAIAAAAAYAFMKRGYLRYRVEVKV